ncbi:putative bifunctional diguanylate cyclase/phosphodiesterase [Pleomorphomonas oryzae]|uniref:putative bifunctional diguanylate cyclase/phosphodiesterase n=1 Tax=Pleomorphomonas oryzae TaxID=261934 RepID=UPI000419FE63|nr:EAL domain-containing protein [Pleomorphomonas oryzae]
MKRLKTFSEQKAPHEASSWKPRVLSLQAIVVGIVGLMLSVLQLAVGVTETVRQLDGIQSEAMYRATAGLDLLTAIPARGAEAGRGHTDAGALLVSLRSIADVYAHNHPGETILIETGREVDDQPSAANDIVTWGDNDLNVRRAFVLGDGSARISGFFSARIDLTDDYAVWHNDILKRAQLAAFIVLSVLMLAVLLMRATVISPLERLSGLTRRLAAGELVEVPKSHDRAQEICDLSEALVVFRNNLAQKDALEAANVVAMRKLERATGNLDMALRSMTQGLALFDAHHRLLLVNQRFLEIFDLSEKAFGAKLSAQDVQDVITARIAATHGAIDRSAGGELFGRHLGQLFTQAEPVSGEEAFGDRMIAFTHVITDEGGWVTTVEDVTERRAQEARLAYLSRFDSLTGLPNRTQFNDRLTMDLAWAADNGIKLAAIGLDLNKFTEINDQRGHSAGDAVLIAIGRRLDSAMQEGEFVGRIGGDEYCALKKFRSQAEVSEFIARIERCFHEPIRVEENDISVGVSIGVAIYPDDAVDAEQLVNNADLAKYRAKRSVTQNVCFYEAAMDEVSRERRAMARDLWDALERDEFHLTYQVQKNIRSRETIGYEALIRWTHPTRGAIPPDAFIPIAEECGAILPIGRWVLRRACQDAIAWNDNLRVAVNLSPVQIANDDIVKLVHETLLETGLVPQRLELEITESTIIGDKAHALHVLRQLKALGITVALDDFGTGYSSLDTLNSFPFDKIKIDRSFLMEAEMKEDSRAIVKAVVALGRSLDVPVLAEGVETVGQLSILEEEGCEEAQGFLFGRPARLTSDEVTETIERSA